MNGAGVDGEVCGIENEELSVGKDLDGDVDGAGEFASGEVGFELEIVASGQSEFGQARLAFELLVFAVGCFLFCHGER